MQKKIYLFVVIGGGLAITVAALSSLFHDIDIAKSKQSKPPLAQQKVAPANQRPEQEEQPDPPAIPLCLNRNDCPLEGLHFSQVKVTNDFAEKDRAIAIAEGMLINRNARADPQAPSFDLTIVEAMEISDSLDFEKPSKVLRATIRYRTPMIILSTEEATPDLNGLRNLIDNLMSDVADQYLSQTSH